MKTRFSLTIVCHWEGGGPLRRAEEVVHILFARVLLLSAPDCLNTVNGSLYFGKIFEAWGELALPGDIYTFATKLLFNILKWLITIVYCVIFVLKSRQYKFFVAFFCLF